MLRTLRENGGSVESLVKLAAIVGKTHPTASRVVDRLAARGLVVLSDGPRGSKTIALAGPLCGQNS